MRLAHLVRLQWLLGTLLIVAAALFAVGVATEGDVHDSHPVTESTSKSAEHNEADEHSGAAEQQETRLLGVNLESTPLVVLAIGVSLAFAAATWRTDCKLVLLATGIFAAGFAALDIAELRHQIEESAATIAVIAGIVAVLHVAAALLAEHRRTALR